MKSGTRPISNLARLGKVDVRRDEDQNVKLGEIIRLLIDAGYFRARVKGLSPFDKIVGGMTWCIEVCNFDVDVDLLFHDSLTIGQKIALTERIVKVLPYMQCPYRIEPHQIQGLDAIHIYPVIQWLVSQALETRVEYKDETRVIALDEFQRHYGYCLPQPKRKEILKRHKLISDLKLRYAPVRRFKTTDESLTYAERDRPLMTLLEYSQELEKPQLHPESDTESIDEEDEDVQTKLGEKMTADLSYNTRSSSQAVSSIVETQVSDIASATEQYLRLKEAETTSGTKDLLAVMEKKVAEMEREKLLKEQDLRHLVSKEENLNLKLESTRDKVALLVNESEQYEHTNSAQSQEILETLSNLLEQNESAKRSASQFKEKCRLEADEIRKEKNHIAEEIERDDSAVDETLQECHAVEANRLKKMRERVSTKTREVELLKRILDEVPGRAELSQYQKRFTELYALVGAKHHETLQFYNMYNALNDSRSYMEKESDLLNSILDNMDRGLATSSSSEEYIKQLQGIIDGIVQNKAKLESKKNEARIERNAVSSELNRLQDLQLQYARVLHLFSQEIANNEILLEN